jgi:hypothetical protein
MRRGPHQHYAQTKQIFRPNHKKLMVRSLRLEAFARSSIRKNNLAFPAGHLAGKAISRTTYRCPPRNHRLAKRNGGPTGILRENSGMNRRRRERISIRNHNGECRCPNRRPAGAWSCSAVSVVLAPGRNAQREITFLAPTTSAWLVTKIFIHLIQKKSVADSYTLSEKSLGPWGPCTLAVRPTGV